MSENPGTSRPDSDATGALDAMTAAPGHHEVLLENERVRVLDARVAPGDKTPVHTHRWPGVLYVVSWSDFIRYDKNGALIFDSRTAASKPEVGAALWSPPLGPHFVHNIGTQELRVIAVELKTPQPSGGPL
jgi:mannose-6-phosphate isomerase-like protein (cupin superfamily)